MFSITTDYRFDLGNPQPALRAIAEAGFTHIHWCHHWNTDFVYHAAEIEQIGRWLKEYGLQLADVHGSEGKEKFWYSPLEYARLAGIELVKNRIDFAAQLGGDAIVMHAYPPTQAPELAPFNAMVWDQLCRSLDELQPYALDRGIRIALENLIDFVGVETGAVAVTAAADNFDLIDKVYAHYPPEYIGFCYDSGHAILGYSRMERIAPLMERLCVLHLHDNNGLDDQHLLPFAGVVEWERVAAYIAQSPYTKPLSYEVSIRNTGIQDDTEFLQQAYATANRFSALVDAQRSNA